MTTIPWGPLGYLTYRRTYSRGKEEYPDTVDRVIRATRSQLGIEWTDEEETFARDMMLSFKGIVAGRFLWQLGTKTVSRLGLASLQNCSATVINDPIRPFTWAMDMLMLGSGVGYNLQKEYVYELPPVRRSRVTRKDTRDADLIVPDSREGWVGLLGSTLRSHFESGGDFTYSTICIRSAGSTINGFGGVASGPEELCTGIDRLQGILNNRAGKKLRPIDCLDIMNIIGSVVVAGNIRRSAQIALGDMDDFQFLNAKRWDLGNVPNWRAMSNNSVVCNDIEQLPEQFWSGYNGNGEPYGLINLKLSRTIGRLGDDRYQDPDIIGVNPCAEIPLSNFETCCLAEIYLPNIRSYEEGRRVAQTLYRITKHSLNLGCHHPETEGIVHRNRRIGIGITGYLQSSMEQRGWLDSLYRELREYDAQYSKQHNWPESIKLTTVKPSGTLSLLAGVTPGCHPGFSQYFIRRIRVATAAPILKQCREAGYPIEPVKNYDGTDDHGTVVVSIPCAYPPGTTLAKETTAIDQLETVKELQGNWADNAVSCTIYYHDNELPLIRNWLRKNYNEGVKSVSFLRHVGHGFVQAPYEEITEEQYLEMKNNCRSITSGDISENDIQINEECETGACPIK